VFTRIVEAPPLVIPPGQPDVTIYKSELEQRTEEAELYLKGIQGEFEEKGIDARMDLGKGPVVEAIVDTAMRHDADLIALASHGHSGLAQVFYGSVAAGILQRVDRPLLLIRSIGSA
jgi:nucleotide-binding universal stress UspA family protein